MPEETSKPTSLLPFAALIVAAVLVGGVYYYVTRPTGETVPAHDNATTASDRSSVKKPASQGGPDRAAAHAMAGSLTVIVRGPQDKPVPGATVTARTGANVSVASGDVLRTATTDSQGRCSIDVPQKQPWLGATGDGYVPVLIDLSKLQAEPGQNREVEMRLVAGTPLRVRVVDALTNAPLDATAVNLYAGLQSGEHQFLFYALTRTDAAGEHVFPRVPPNTNLMAMLEHPTHDYLTTAIRVAPGDEALQVFRLTQRMVLSGRVIDSATGKGVAGAQVEVSPDAPPSALRALQVDGDRIRTATTDTNGEFTLEKMSHGKLFFMVEAKGYAPTPHMTEVTAEQEKPFVEIHLNTASVLAGVVVDEAGQPVVGTLVYVTPAGAVLGNMSKERNKKEGFVTGPDGRFRFENIPPQAPYIVHAENEHYVEAISEPVRLLPGVGREDLVLKLARGGTITGMVTTTSGTPLGKVRIQASLPARFAREPLAPVVSAGDGTFSIERVPEAAYNLSFTLDGYCETTLPRVPYNAIGVKAALAKQAVITGQVLAAADLTAVKRFKIRYREAGRPVNATEKRVSNVEGKFTLETVRPGVWDFEFRADAFAKTLLSQVTVLEGQELDLGRVVMREGAAVEGYVVDTNNQPVFRALIELDPLESFDQHDKDYYYLRTTTDKKGYYKVRNLVAGEYQLSTIHSKFALEKAIPVVVDKDATVRQDITLRQGAKVIVEVLDEYGMPVEGANITLRNKDIPPPISSPGHRSQLKREPNRGLSDQGSGLDGRNPSDKNGRAHFLRQPAGNYMLMVGARGYGKEMREFTLDWGEEHNERIVLQSAKGGGQG